MTDLNFTTPTVGQQDSTEEPLIVTALNQIKSTVNGNLDKDNIDSNAGILRSQLASGPIFSADDFDLVSPAAYTSSGVLGSTLNAWSHDFGVPSIPISNTGYYFVGFNGCLVNVAGSAGTVKLGLRVMRDRAGVLVNVTGNQLFTMNNVANLSIPMSAYAIYLLNSGDILRLEYYTSLSNTYLGSIDGSTTTKLTAAHIGS